MMRRFRTFLLTFALILFGIISTPTTIYATTETKPIMEVHFIDVGQGDCTLIKCNGKSMLIDAGDNDKGTAVQLYLKKQGIKNLDYLVLTHPDADHIGGADVIVTKFGIDQIFMSPYEKDNKTYDELIQAIDYKNMKWSTPSVGSQYTLGNASFTIIAPNDTYEDPNNSSIGLILKNGKNSFLFTGDAEEEAESDILGNKINISADVYQAGHHGSKTASSSVFLKKVNPTYAVISCAEGNKYGHPHSATLNNLRTMGVQVFRTDEQGSIVAISNGSTITWNCAPSETWQAGEPTGSSVQNKESTIAVVPNSESASSSTPANNEITETPTVEATPEAIAPVGITTTYICNTNTQKFHYPNCSSVDQMKEKNKKEVNCSRDELISQGYVPCKRCCP